MTKIDNNTRGRKLLKFFAVTLILSAACFFSMLLLTMDGGQDGSIFGITIIFGIVPGLIIDILRAIIRFIRTRKPKTTLPKLNKETPKEISEFILYVMRKMGYRKKVRAEVQAELVAHFEDELECITAPQEREETVKELIENFGDPKLLGKLLRRAKKRCRPLWRKMAARSFQLIGLSFVCLLLYILWLTSGEPVARIDYVKVLNEKAPLSEDETLNAFPYIIKGIDALPELTEEKLKITRTTTIPESLPGMGQSFNSASEYTVSAWGEPYSELSDIHKQVIKEIIEDASEAFSWIEKAAAKPHFWQTYSYETSIFGMRTIDYKICQDIQYLSDFLFYSAYIKAEQGDFNSAFKDLLTCYKLGRLMMEGPKLLIEQLAGISLQGKSVEHIRNMLYKYNLTSYQLANLSERYTNINTGRDCSITFELSKITAYDGLQRTFTDGGFGGGISM
ncbi:hypothetical protein SMSP2_02474 [Limihaloglobus sulfuriphilus]|uniref:Uncharacterized protein n=1 Tax=Limihaloglobus sulfuriphilus TaxID=1851148 RepID=A0A1Q2MHF7_9BACT|nr:hypothetical protein [Limihaloglobus sulfuriphilus]AQQ72094.1 hypothetical protein SMSP2_02474 [Limihaloglobus sulfuriphilus]